MNTKDMSGARITGDALAAAINATALIWVNAPASKVPMKLEDVAKEVRAAVLLLRGPDHDSKSMFGDFSPSEVATQILQDLETSGTR